MVRLSIFFIGLVCIVFGVGVLRTAISRQIATQKKFYFQSQMEAFHARIDEMVLPGAILFVGDSSIQGLYVRKVDVNAVNFGIGGDTTSGVLRRLSNYKSLKSAKAVVIAAGFNDLLHHAENEQIINNIQAILEILPYSASVYLCSVPPVAKPFFEENLMNQIVSLNMSMQKLCAKQKNLIFVDIWTLLAGENGELMSNYHIGDGVHLNVQGRHLIIDLFRKKIGNPAE